MIYLRRKWTGANFIISLRKIKRSRRINIEYCINMSEGSSVAKRHTQKRVRKYTLHCDQDGNLTDLDPKDTYGYKLYSMSPKLSDNLFVRKFRLRFQITYVSCIEFLYQVKSHDMLKRWHQKRNNNKVIGLLLLGSLHYLGREWTFENLEETTSISEEVHHNFPTLLLLMEVRLYISHMLNIQEML